MQSRFKVYEEVNLTDEDKIKTRRPDVARCKLRVTYYATLAISYFAIALYALSACLCVFVTVCVCVCDLGFRMFVI